MSSFHDIPPEVVQYLLEYSVFDGRPLLRELTALDDLNATAAGRDSGNAFVNMFSQIAAEMRNDRAPYAQFWNKAQVRAAARGLYGRFSHGGVHFLCRNLDLGGSFCADENRHKDEKDVPYSQAGIFARHCLQDAALKFLRFAHVWRLDLSQAALSARGLHKLLSYCPCLIDLKVDLYDAGAATFLRERFSFDFSASVTRQAMPLEAGGGASSSVAVVVDNDDDEFKDVHPILRKKMQQQKRLEQQRAARGGRGRGGARTSPATQQQRLQRALAKQQL